MFKIMIVVGPAEKYISKCLESFVNQSFENWEAQIVIDPMGDKTYENALKYQSDKIKIHLNEKREYALSNLLKASKMLNPSDEDILVTMDGDDWLYVDNALEIVDSYYKRFPDILITHGSWIGYPDPKVLTNNSPYTEIEFKKNIRKFAWRASQLRTFKYKVWKHIKDEDLRNAHGEYYTSAWDLAMMWPMLEISGYDRVKFVREKIYVYNQETPYNDSKVRVKEQMYYTDYLAAKPPYKYRKDL